MALPNYSQLQLPVLEYLATRGERSNLREIREAIAKKQKISPEEAAEKLSGGETKLAHRVRWATNLLERAGLIDRLERGVYCISKSGHKYWRRNPKNISINDLEEFSPDFKKWWRQIREQRKQTSGIKPREEQNAQTEEQEDNPEENLANAYAKLQRILKEELKDKWRDNQPGKKLSPAFLENVAVKLLKAMGYGNGKRTGGPKDRGIDGIMLIDELGIQKIAIQTKKNKEENKVRIQSMQKFLGSLEGKGISAGIFITTSDFTKDALDFVKENKGSKNITLINGDKLAELMIKHNVGVRVKSCYVVKQIDEDFFVEE